jgi:uncharacterized membrane protein HdeD (DUF308 family)
MIRLLLLLLGGDFVRRRWSVLLLGGLLWTAIGCWLVVDSINGTISFPVHFLGVFLALDGLVTLYTARHHRAGTRHLRYVKGVATFAVAVLVLAAWTYDDAILAVLFGVAFAIDAILGIAAVRVVRFAGWRLSLAFSIVELLVAIHVLIPYPVHYSATATYCIGLWFIFSGISLILPAIRGRGLPPDTSLALVLSRGYRRTASTALPIGDSIEPPHPLIVHVWTPMGASDDPRRVPIVDRYIAAVDRKGVISTGHAALEVPETLYVSFYPQKETDHASTHFAHLLRATRENDVPGKFQPSYAYESAEWCPSTWSLAFPNYDLVRLQEFVTRYRADTTYNLTDRNCSTTTAHCLEVAVEGILWRLPRPRRAVLRALLNPELLIASQLRRRAELMAWTPGLVLDYARTLRVLLDPPPFGWLTLARWARHLARRQRSERHERARQTAPA